MKCPNCGAEPNGNFCEYCGSIFPKEEPSTINLTHSYYVEDSTPLQEKETAKRKTWLWILGWIFFFPVPLTILLLKNNRLNPVIKYALIVVIWAFVVILGVSEDNITDSPSPINPTCIDFNSIESQSATISAEISGVNVEDADSWWSDVISEELANDIQGALLEIGVDNKIKSIYLDETRDSNIVVVRIYKLDTTTFSYWIWTREWSVGEPEHETYPAECLTAIKNWHPDGHMGTSLWDIDGTGSEQIYKLSDALN